jgi:hypothetical protein
MKEIHDAYLECKEKLAKSGSASLLANYINPNIDDLLG